MASDSARGLRSRIRTRLEGAPGLTHTVQAGRAVVHFGPWRHVARAMIRRARPPHASIQPPYPGLELNAPHAVRALRRDGMALVGQLPPDLLGRIRAVTDRLPSGQYGDFHAQPDVRALVLGDDALRVVRGYFGAEPELLECTLVVHHAEDPADPNIHEQRRFHFDFAGWQSLNLFVYLTDVSGDSGAHEIVLGTQRKRHFKDAIRPYVPDDEMMARYPDRLHTITGPAGTMFFENTEAFHRRQIMKRRRAMLNVLYASHRSWTSHGRLTPKYADYVRPTVVETGEQPVTLG